MKHEFRLADIGEGLEEAEIIAWQVTVGEQVTRDQPLVEVMTDKSNAELPAPWSGTVVELGPPAGEMLAVGAIIAVIDDGQETEQASRVDPAPAPAAGWSEREEPSSELARPRPKASPATRREAARRGIDLHDVVPSGPGGRIVLADLDAADATSAPPAARPAPPEPSPAPPEPSPNAPDSEPTAPGSSVVPLRGIRRRVAANMTQSWSEIPHIHAFELIDGEALVTTRAQVAEARPGLAKISPLAFFVAAVASALRAHPAVNASLDMAKQEITYHDHANVGVAVATDQGLVVPVLMGADAMGFEQLVAQLDDLVSGARAGMLAPAQFRRGTATVTNFGSLGGESATPLIRPPEAVIVGFGSIAERPMVIDGQVLARRSMHVVVGADHRLIDGDQATAFLTHVANKLRNPVQLLLGD